jgi:hypothetical protein
MSSSASELHARWAPSIAAAGTAAYAFPLIVPWHILFLLIAAGAGLALMATATTRLIWSAVCVAVLVAVLLGQMPSPLAAAVISASLLGMSGLPSIGAAILTMHISVVATVQDYVAESISAVGVEAAGPALVAVGILWLARASYGWYAVASGALSILIACAVARAIHSPEGAMALSALPACALAALAARHERPVGAWLR